MNRKQERCAVGVLRPETAHVLNDIGSKMGSVKAESPSPRGRRSSETFKRATPCAHGRVIGWLGILLCLLMPLRAAAEEPEATPSSRTETMSNSSERSEPADKTPSDASLAQEVTNPVAALVSVPFQFNWENGVGPNDDVRFILNIQPVVPIELSKDWNLIGRLIVPLISQPVLVAGGEPRFGMGDQLLSLFLSPARAKTFVWGVGPVLGLPAGTDPVLGTGKWMTGPTAVGLFLVGPWTAGALVNHVWSFASTGDVDRADVNRTFLQPFVALTLPTATTISLQSETLADWKAPDGEKWTVPLNASVSQLTAFGPFPMTVQLGGGVYLESPAGGPEWRLRLAFTLLLPRAKKGGCDRTVFDVLK